MSPSPWGRAVASARAADRDLVDLTQTNPTLCGLRYPPEVYRALVDVDVASYEPEPLGLETARTAVVEHYAAKGAACDKSNVWIAAGTSEIYAQLLALCCDPGDAVLVPRPGYPLLAHVAELSGVRTASYDLRYDGRWEIDREGLGRKLEDEDVRALVVVSPGNPTGHCMSHADLKFVENVCRTSGTALIVDEVFADYALRDATDRVTTVVGDRACLCFAVSGLSKVAALPQLKISWVVACGPRDAARDAMARVELINDTFLSAATPTQHALPRLLAAAPSMQSRIRSRLRGNARTLERVVETSPCDVLRADGGWTALIRMPEVEDLDDIGWALRLLETEALLTQPGYLFDIEGPPHLALSLLCDEDTFASGVARLHAALARLPSA